jgi:cellulose synthase (UDP-forming)
VRETVAHMIFGDSASWEAVRASRNHKMGLIAGFAYVLRLSVQGIWHTTRALAAEPARLQRQRARAQNPVTAEEGPAHLLAFGETFDPPLPARAVSLANAQASGKDGVLPHFARASDPRHGDPRHGDSRLGDPRRADRQPDPGSHDPFGAPLRGAPA